MHYTHQKKTPLLTALSRAADNGNLSFDVPGHTTSWLVSHPELASLPGPYAIERHWGVVLFGDFHDVSGGACERLATGLTVQQLGRAEFSAGEIMAEAAQSIGAGIDTRGPGRALLVFNPHAFPLRQLVETGDINFHPYFDDARVVQVEVALEQLATLGADHERGALALRGRAAAAA